MKYITFSQAYCKNCYKCLRSCPVKAIKFENEQAEILMHKCIACGHCYIVCPHSARDTVSDLEKVKKAIASKQKIVASVDPSFAGSFDMPSGRFAALLKHMGISYVEEAISGNHIVSNLYKEYIDKNKQNNYITTACTSANYLIEKYYPSLVKLMIPIVSPMVAHSKLLRETYGDNVFIVFIGPCIGKKIESEGFVNKGVLDAVLTFNEILDLSKELGADFNELGESNFDRKSYVGANTYASYDDIHNGITPFLHRKDIRILSVSGTEECLSLFKSIEKGELNNYFIHVSMCKGSCIGGPSMITNEYGYYRRLERVENYLRSSQTRSCNNPTYSGLPEFTRSFRNKTFPRKIASENELQDVMNSMAKYLPEDELNCGVCGYNTCREKAQAVFEGMSETTMCLQYMRSRAESLRNVIFENSVNSILLLDGDMNIKDINPAAELAFSTKAEYVKNKNISLLIDAEDFKYVKQTGNSIISKKVSYPKYNMDCIETVVYIPKQNIVMVALVDITKEEVSKKKLYELKESTVNAAQQVIEKQMRVAQEIASLLGETTAETKITLTKLKKVVEHENS